MTLSFKSTLIKEDIRSAATSLGVIQKWGAYDNSRTIILTYLLYERVKPVLIKNKKKMTFKVFLHKA